MDKRTTFTMDAVPHNFRIAQKKVREFLAPAHCSMRTLLELDILVEEVFINIASYAYEQQTGTCSIDLSLNDSLDTLTMTFRDKGIPYNPLTKPAPDLSPEARKNSVGGLGIFLVNKYSDSLSYEYADRENRLTVYKKLS